MELYKHWIIYKLPRKLKNKRHNEPEWGDLSGVYHVSKRATEIEAQKMAEANPGWAYAVLEVSNVFTTDVPPVVQKNLEDMAPEAEADLPEPMLDIRVNAAGEYHIGAAALDPLR